MNQAFIRLFSMFQAFLLVSLLLLQLVPAHAAASADSKTYLIGFKKQERAKVRAIQRSSVEPLTGQIVVAELTESEKQAMLEDENVAYIEEDSETELAEANLPPGQSQQVPWGIEHIGAAAAHSQQYKGQRIKIGVLDTGISAHPDLEVKGGISYIEGEDDFGDQHGHGTAVAGVIAARDNDFGIVGVAPEAELYAIKVLDKKGHGTYSSMIQGIEWAIQNRMNILSISAGGYVDSRALHDQIKRANEHGILVIAAAGNRGLGEETELFPAQYAETISVGAVDQEDQRADFSSVGKELDLMAPGVDIRSTAPGGDYQTRSGTSLAVPHVAGAAAVIWSAKGNISRVELRDLLTKSATPLGESRFYGKGLVHLEKALGQGEGSAEIEALLPSVSELKLAQGESQPLKVTAKRTDGSEQDVTKRVSYAVQDESIAKVSAAGLVRALGPGETKVTGELEGHHFEVSVTVTPPEPLRPLAGLDRPENGEWTSGMLNGKGWYLAPAGVASIRIQVDGADAGEAQYGQPRPDIAAKYPAYGNPNAGFTFQLDTQTLTTGAHTLAVIIENTAGEKTTIAGRAFYVGETPLPEGLQADVQKLELAPGNSHPLKISVILEDRSVKDVTQQATYVSADPGVVTVSEKGVVQAVGVGSASLTVTYEDKTLTIPVQVKEETPLPARGEVERPANNATVAGNVLVEGWYLDPAGVAKIEVQLDGTRLGEAQYGLARRDIEAAYPDYRNPAAGFQFLLPTSAVPEGAHVLKVIVSSKDGTEHVLAERIILVEKEQPATSISAAPEKVEVSRGKTQQLRISAVLSDQGTKDVTAGATYTAEHPHVASISPSGMVTGLEAGQTTITVHYQEHVLTVPVTVQEAAGFIQGGIDTPPDNATISGVYPITGWYFHSGGVAKVEVLVDGVPQGEAAYGIPRPEVEITDVSSPNHDIGFQFDLDTSKLQEGTHTLSVRGTGQDGTQTMLGERKIQIVPLLPAKSLQANSTALSLPAGKTHLLVVKAILDDESEHDVTKLARYTVDNLSIAKVNADGLVTAITPGTANLTISYAQQSLSIPITVTEAGPLSAMGEIETPVQGAVIEGTSTVAGWFVATTPITRYEVLVDGTKKGEAKAGIARPDIALLYPDYANSHAGFSLTLEGSDLPAGEHTVAVVAIDPEGKSHPLPEKRFVIGKQPPILRLQPQEPTVTLPKDSSKKLTISALLTEQTTKEITGEAQYTVEKAEIIHISPLGVVTGLQVGQTNVVASYGGQSVTIPVTVTETEAGSTQPKGQLELPFDRAVIGGVTTVQGWLLDPSGIGKVEVLVDGQAVGTAEYGVPRPDIAAMYPHYRQANAGFRYQWDTLSSTEGAHKLTIRATNQAGQESLVLEKDVVIGPVAKLTANLTQIALEKDKTVAFQLTATHRDNSTKDVTAEATYAFENPALAKIEAPTGLITGLLPGNTQLRVSYAGIVQTYPVQVQGDGPSHGGELDTPADNEVISGNYLVTGWFLPEGELDKIEVLLDETVLGEALYGTERPDVLRKYPGNQGAKPGFSYGLRAEEQPKGTHKLTVRVTEKDGKQTNLERTVTIVEAIEEANRYWLQFSKEQGKHNWSYLEAKEDRYTELVWNQENEQWKSPQGETISGNTWMKIGGSDPVIRWEAPRSGKIHVGGWAAMLEGNEGDEGDEGDGIHLRLLKNDTQIWPSAGWQSIAFNDQIGVELAQELEVEAGDKLYFQAQAKETEVGDSFKWTPEIHYLSTNIPDNAAPRVYITTPVTGKVIDQVNGQDVIPLSGWVMDPNIGDRVSLWYQIDEGEVHQIASFLASENASAFLYHAPVQDLKPDDVYSLKIWATDQKQGLSPVQQVDFTLDMRAQAKEKDPIDVGATWNSPANDAEINLGERVILTWDYSTSYGSYLDKITGQELTIYISEAGRVTSSVKEKLSANTRSYELNTSTISKSANVEARLRTILSNNVPAYVSGTTVKRFFKILTGNQAPVMESTELMVIYGGQTGQISFTVAEKDATDKLVARKIRIGLTPGGNELKDTMESIYEVDQGRRFTGRYQFPITKDMLFQTIYWTAQAQDNRGAWSEPQVYSARLVDRLPYLAVYTTKEKRIIDLKETFTLDGTYSRLQAGDTLTGTIYPATYVRKTTSTTGSAGYWSLSWLGQELGEGTYTNTEIRSASGHVASYSGVLVVERKPGAPVIVKTEPTKNAITVYWNPSPGASTYQIRLDNNLARNVGNVTSYTFSGLQPGRAYTIMLWAYSPSGISSYPASISVETLPAEETFTLLQENSPIRMYYPADQAKYFKLTAKTSGTYQFTLTNDSSSLTPGKIAVFRSASLQTPDQIASGENGSVSVALVAGKTYYLSVQSRSSLYATLLAKPSGEAIVFNQAKELTISAGQSVELSMNALIPGTYRTMVQLKNPGSKYPTVAVLSNGTLVSPKQKPSEAEAVYELASGSYIIRLTNNDTTALSLSFTVFAPLAGGTLYEYVYDANNRITAIKENGANSVTFTHDENGNLLKSVKQAVSPQPKATALKLDSDRVDVSSGGSASIKVTATLENGSQVDVTSQVTVIVENPSVAYISNGRVYAVNGGTTQARLYYGGQTKTLTITVSAPAISLSSISLSPAQTTLAEGQIQRVYATAYYTDGSSKDINSVASFSSSSPSVAQVSSQGIVTGIAPGTATISASYNGKSASAQITVQGAYLLGLKASPAQLSLAAGNKGQLSIYAQYSNGVEENVSAKAQYTSGNPVIASVDSTGGVVATTAGTTTIQVTFGTKSLSVPVTVTGNVVTLQTISVRPESVSVKKGATQQLEVKATYSDNKVTDVTSQASYQIAQSAIATASATGLITGAAIGSTTMTVTFGGKTVSVPVQVTEAQEPVQSLTVTPAKLDLLVGKTQTLQVTATYKDGKEENVSQKAMYTSSNATIASVNSSGLVTALAEGTAQVTIQYGGKSISVPVTGSVVSLQTLAVRPESVSVKKGSTQQLEVKATYSDNKVTDVTSQATYQIAQPAIATASATGLITGTAVGSTTMTVTFGGKTVSVPVQITEAREPVQSLTVTPAKLDLVVGKTQTLQVTATYQDGKTADVSKLVTYLSQDPATAIVQPDGLVTAVKAGSTSLTVTYEGVSINVPVVVTAENAVVDIKIVPEAITLLEKATKQLVVKAVHADGTESDITDKAQYTVDDPSIASVSASGSLTAKKAGTATLTAAFSGKQRSVAVKVNDAGVQLQSLSAGMAYTQILRADGSLWATGQNEHGQLGNGTMQNQTTPVPVMVDVVITQLETTSNLVEMNAYESKPLKVTATYANGHAQDVTHQVVYESSQPELLQVDQHGVMTSGEMGGKASVVIRYYDQQLTIPVQVKGIPRSVQYISAGMNYTLIMTDDGSFWATGQNESGQLGDGTMQNRNSPIKIIGQEPGRVTK
ncbi:peptidase S8 [Brevibacillus parabrevis]|uniref:Ig-like domain-containing protein n=2 Tax=Brevibacillus TaxID=55080 RepID=UPI0007ABC842|nr:Ig-like domain-containing protein [Brevibacillus parabrevis]KZE44081.1 peptidase S8 [Brevibacillus parabrevis]